ncbi:DUF6338 family protein [Promicromonospora iranensis]|uniref:Uncharacterized protein n=1 Tax=Promicromonospora iranensis TaxID=1105144 RepID=A0ABU2CQ99_9MICO|nr:DUF6338 family protein [Promicromonospora iranensis]MDR7383505.1 hypothetical protein [Promicromonospora iranensis]
MVPESLATVYAFLGLVAPGLLFQLLRERARPALEESAFREASRVALTSLAFTTASILILAAASAVAPRAVVDLAGWLESGSEYVSEHLWLVVSSVLLEVGLACALAWLSATALAVWVDDQSVKHAKTSIWHLAILESRPKGEETWLSIELMDGVKVWGYVHYFTTDLAMDNRELSLTGPGLSIQRVGEERKSVTATYLVLPGSDIRRMKVSYEPAMTTEPGTGSGAATTEEGPEPEKSREAV